MGKSETSTSAKELRTINGQRKNAIHKNVIFAVFPSKVGVTPKIELFLLSYC